MNLGAMLSWAFAPWQLYVWVYIYAAAQGSGLRSRRISQSPTLLLMLPRPQNETRRKRRWNRNFSFFSFTLPSYCPAQMAVWTPVARQQVLGEDLGRPTLIFFTTFSPLPPFPTTATLIRIISLYESTRRELMYKENRTSSLKAVLRRGVREREKRGGFRERERELIRIHTP